MTKRQTLLDAILVRRVDTRRAPQSAAALGIFGLEQMPFAGARAQDFSPRGNLEPLRHGFLGLNAFGTSHKSIKCHSKRARNIDSATQRKQALIYARKRNFMMNSGKGRHEAD